MVELTSQCPSSREMKTEGAVVGRTRTTREEVISAQVHPSVQEDAGTLPGHRRTGSELGKLSWLGRHDRGLPCAGQGCHAGSRVGPAKAMNGTPSSPCCALYACVRLKRRGLREPAALWTACFFSVHLIVSNSFRFTENRQDSTVSSQVPRTPFPLFTLVRCFVTSEIILMPYFN